MRDWKTQCSIDIARQLDDDAVRAKQQAEAKRWRTERRPQALRHLEVHATSLRWSRRPITLLLDELYTDDLFRETIKDEHGVIKIRLGLRKSHTIYSVPESVAVRIHTRLLKGG